MDTFGTQATLECNSRTFHYSSLRKLDKSGIGHVARLPFSLKILLENLLRREDGRSVTAAQIEALASWSPNAANRREIAFQPARVLLQDFTGVPAVVDLAAMRDAMVDNLHGDPKRINPLQDVELVIDHSVQVDAWGTSNAFRINADKEFHRNRERYELLKWGQQSLRRFQVLPPDTGIVHQVNLEHLARVIFEEDIDDRLWAYPDTLVGTDSHTTMVNGLGVLGWGVGGIEAEAAMLGQPLSMLIPDVVGFRLSGKLPDGATATDLVLTVTEMLRRYGVVGKFVEFFGAGLSNLTVADRATIGNMSPEYGSTCAIFPIDAATLDYLRLTGRSEQHIKLVREYSEAQGLFRTDLSEDPIYSGLLELDLGSVEPCIAGPKRPQDRVPLRNAKASFEAAAHAAGRPATAKRESGAGGVATLVREQTGLRDGSVVIAAITSCTNTSNPAVLVAAGLLAKSAVEKGLMPAPWVKTSFAPGSRVVTDYLHKAQLTPYLEALGFYLVGYGCTTCIGNSGPLDEPIAEQVTERQLLVCAVLSGNRNFEGRIHPLVRANYLMSPPLVVAYALAGRMDIDLTTEPLGVDKSGDPVYLRDIWPDPKEISRVVADSVAESMFRHEYARAFEGNELWRSLSVSQAERFAWQPDSTYVRRPPFFEGMTMQPPPLRDIQGARVLALLGDSVTTDHISPAGSIAQASPAGKYLIAQGVTPADFNSYGARRGNHEVMIRGTFANIRLRNFLAPGTEGGVTRHLPDGEQGSIYDVALRYEREGTPLIVIAGKEYGSGSSRDWAAKGPRLLGVRAVIAESFERIHRSNLIGMGILPLQFTPEDSAQSLGLSGEERYEILGIKEGVQPGKPLTVKVQRHGEERPLSFEVVARIDTPDEAEYYRHDGILPYVMRQLNAQITS